MYSIATVQEKTGLSGRQIRYYEKMGLLKVERTAGNQRRFTDKDVERLLKIKDLLEENLDLETVKQVLDNKQPPNDKASRVIDNSSLPTAKTLSSGLTSLYPVSNRAELVHLLSSIEVKRPKKGE